MLSYIDRLGNLHDIEGEDFPPEIPEDEYEAELRDVEHRRSKAGNEMLVLRWALKHPLGNDTVKIVEEYATIGIKRFGPLLVLHKLAGEPFIAHTPENMLMTARKLKGTKALVQYKEKGFSYVTGASGQD